MNEGNQWYLSGAVASARYRGELRSKESHIE